MNAKKHAMADKERADQLLQALTAARWSISWWARNPAYSAKRQQKLDAELAKYDNVIVQQKAGATND